MESTTNINVVQHKRVPKQMVTVQSTTLIEHIPMFLLYSSIKQVPKWIVPVQYPLHIDGPFSHVLTIYDYSLEYNTAALAFLCNYCVCIYCSSVQQ